MEITAGRVCQMMSKGALLAAGQQRKAFEVSNLKINLLGVGKKKQNPQAGRTQVTAALMAGTQHRLWRAAPVLCPGCGTYREPLQHGTTMTCLWISTALHVLGHFPSAHPSWAQTYRHESTSWILPPVSRDSCPQVSLVLRLNFTAPLSIPGAQSVHRDQGLAQALFRMHKAALALPGVFCMWGRQGESWVAQLAPAWLIPNIITGITG